MAAGLPEPGQPGTRWLSLAVLCVALLMVNLDNTVLNVALPTLVRDLHATDPKFGPFSGWPAANSGVVSR